ncbi:hypothetical protein N9C57_02355 [Gammaproteobacteria bacterium]|nr:hypothetical protein [Gammaproteobacteria bacterium]
MLNKLIELSLNSTFRLINLFYLSRYFKKNNKFNLLKNIHDGKRVFILLNGKSLKNYDLNFLKDEIVICTNHFNINENYNMIKPKYHCATDNNFFDIKNFPHRKKQLEELIAENPNTNYIFNQKYKNFFDEKSNVFCVYSKHLPTRNNLSLDFSKNVSSFSNISLFAISLALYLGSKEIYIMGMDFEPGVFSHFYDEKNKDSILNRSNKDEVFGWYMGYTRTHLESYYLNEHARKNNTKIFNLNYKSYMRAYDFKDFNDLPI